MAKTEKQILRIKAKIDKIKKALASERRMYGCYDDSAGRRYLPPELYIQIQDYKGGLNYTRWFNKNFPDDIGMPEFLFEWTIILFKNGKLKEAEKKAIETYCSNVYLLDKYFKRLIVLNDIYEGSNMERPEYTEYLTYTKDNPELADFTEWLDGFMNTQKFINITEEYINIRRQLKYTEGYEARHELTQLERKLLEEID